MKSSTTLIIAILMASVSANAAEYLTLHFNNGTKIAFKIEDEPQIKINSESVSIGIGQYTFDDLQKYTFENEDSNSTVDIVADNDERLNIDGNVLIVSASDSNQQIALYDLSGICISTSKAENGKAQIDLSGLNQGIYLLKIGDESFKILKR